MAFVSFYKSAKWNFKIFVSKVNGESLGAFRKEHNIDENSYSELEENLNRKNLNFDYFNVENDSGDIVEIWDNLEINIELSDYPIGTKHVLCYTNSKYSQRSSESGLHPSIFTEEKIQFNLKFYRNRWSGPVVGNIQFFDEDKKLISITKDFIFYTDERDTPPFGGGLFELKDSDFSDESDVNHDLINHWKTIVQKTDSTKELVMFDRGSKKIRIFLNSSVKNAKRFLDNVKILRGKNRATFGLLDLALHSAPFNAYVSEILYPLGVMYDEVLKNLEFTKENPTTFEKSEKNLLIAGLKEIIKKQKAKLNFDYKDMRVLAINLYEEIDKTEDKILYFAFQASSHKERILIQGRAQLLLSRLLDSSRYINENLTWDDKNKESKIKEDTDNNE